MAKTTGKSEDLLGLLALGGTISVLGNLAQADKKRRLQAAYDHVVERYRQLEREYAALRNLNVELQNQVIVLRTENNRLLAEAARKPESNQKP